jgi:Endoplasmic reticulum vesicle transporter
MYRLPCSILSLDVQDVMGSHSVNVHGTLLKDRLDKSHNVLSQMVHKTKAIDAKEDHHHEENEQPDYEEVKKQIIEGEGCRLYGTFLVNKVPGNFHISSHAFGYTIQRLFSDGITNFDVNHKIHHISFGDDSDIKLIKSTFNTGILNPLDNVEKADEHVKKTYEYYLKVVPTTYEDIKGKKYYVHQFTSNSNEMVTNMLPAAYFRYFY